MEHYVHFGNIRDWTITCLIMLNTFNAGIDELSVMKSVDISSKYTSTSGVDAPWFPFNIHQCLNDDFRLNIVVDVGSCSGEADWVVMLRTWRKALHHHHPLILRWINPNVLSLSMPDNYLLTMDMIGRWHTGPFHGERYHPWFLLQLWMPRQKEYVEVSVASCHYPTI